MPQPSSGSKLLSAYLEANGLLEVDFAEKMRYSASYVSMLCTGDATPSLTRALQIEEATKPAAHKDHAPGTPCDCAPAVPATSWRTAREIAPKRRRKAATP